MMAIITLTKFDGGDDRIGMVDGIEALVAAFCQGWMACYLPTNVGLKGLNALLVKDATHDGTPMNSRAPNDAER